MCIMSAIFGQVGACLAACVEAARLMYILKACNISLLTLSSCSPDKTYVFIATYRMVGAVLSAPCALVGATAERRSRPSPLTMLLDAVGTTNAATLLHSSAAIIHILPAIATHVLLSPFLLSGLLLLAARLDDLLAREFH